MNYKYAFYFQKNNLLFKDDIISICCEVDNDSIEKYSLTSKYIEIFIKSKKIKNIMPKKDCNYIQLINEIVEDNSLLRIQCECFLGMYGDSHCDCEKQRKTSIDLISENDGIFIHLPQEAQGWGLFYKHQELELQVSGRNAKGEFVGIHDRDAAQEYLTGNEKFNDVRKYDIIKEILIDLNIANKKFYLVTDSDKKISSLKKTGLNVIKYSDGFARRIDRDNISEYLAKIYNETHNYEKEIIDELLIIISKRSYNERTLTIFLKIIERLKHDNAFFKKFKYSDEFLNTYEEIICGDEKKYIIGNENNVKIQNSFFCEVSSAIFKTLKDIYGNEIFDRISFEKIYFFENTINKNEISVRKSEILDNINEKCVFMNHQHYSTISRYDGKDDLVRNEDFSSSALNAFFENPLYIYKKRDEMVTMISENVVPKVNIYIKKIPIKENRIMEVYGKREDIRDLINKVFENNPNVLMNIISDDTLTEKNMSEYNLRFSDKNAVISEELEIYKLMRSS